MTETTKEEPLPRRHGLHIDQLARAVLRVGDGRGFVVERLNYLGRRLERIVITAAHCIEHATRADGGQGLPPCHPARYLEEGNYRDLLGPLGDASPTVWAECLFVDSIADIAVLGQPDNQALSDKADAFDELVEGMTALAVADAPAQGFEILPARKLGQVEPDEIKVPTPGEGAARVLSLDGHWLDGCVKRRPGWLAFEPDKHMASGMSGSPIINMAGEAIGVCSTEFFNPVIVDSLSARLVRAITAANSIPPNIKKRFT